MMLKNIFVCLIFSCLLFSQIEEEQLKVKKKYELQSKNIQKKYPDRSIDSNLKSIIDLDNSLDYSIINIEPISNFETSFLSAQKIDSEDLNSTNYKHYLRVGVGNYNKLISEVSFNFELNKETTLSINYDHLSTSGFSSKKFSTESDYNQNIFQASIYQQSDHLDMKISSGFDIQKINYYGFSNFDLSPLKNNIQNRYINLFIQGHVDNLFETKSFDYSTFKIYHFSDIFSNKESSLEALINIKQDSIISNYITDNLNFGIESNSNIAFVNSSFKLNNSKSDANFSFFNIGVHPKIKFAINRNFLQLGTNIQYVNQSNCNEFHFYPTIKVTYFGLEWFEFFVVIDGGIKLNSYQNLILQNPFLNPNLDLKLTNQLINLYGGINGVFSKKINHQLVVGFDRSNNFVFFVQSDEIKSKNPRAYEHLNSLVPIYDNGNRFFIQAEASTHPIEKLDLSGNLLFQSFILNTLKHSYHVPSFRLNLKANYKFLNDKLMIEMTGIIVGKRKSNSFETFLDNNSIIQFNQKITTLKSYFDLNLQVNYRNTSYWSIFIIGNNLLGQIYDRFLNYPVLGIQFVSGIRFKF